MSILVLGAKGMLGRDLAPILRPGYEVIERDVEDFDITDLPRVKEEIRKLLPRVVINAAAYTDVDGCETRKELAFAVNAEGAGNVALSCASIGAKVIYLSTDYIFDGESKRPYREEDPPHPLNIYGMSKLEGERRIQETADNYLIIRNEWLFGKYGRNFVDTILRLASQQEELRVVDDQRGSPTFTKDLSRAIERLIEKEATGVVNVTNSGSCTWFEFARRILKGRNFSRNKVIPVSSAELGRPAKRPANSLLDCRYFGQLTGIRMRPWEEALAEYLQGLN